MNRSRRDANLATTKYLPAAAATNYSDSIDLGSVEGDPGQGIFDIEIAVPAAPNNVDSSKTTLITLQDSADNVTFADVAPLHQLQIAGVGSTGSAAVTKAIRPPPHIRRYIRFSQVVPSGAGDNTAVLAAYALLF